MSLAVVVVLSLLVLCAAMVAVAAIYLSLVWFVSLHQRPRQRPLEDNRMSPKKQGLSEADLQRLPTIECRKEKGGEEQTPGGGEGECAVCLESFQIGDWCRVIPACSHAFHVYCADAWLSKRSTCPICRRSAACESRKTNAVNGGAAAAALQEEEGRDHDQESGHPDQRG